MKLKEYLDKLNNLAKTHPEALDMDVIYFTDDEGSDAHSVECTPSFGWVIDLDEYYLNVVSEEDLDGDEIKVVVVN